MERRTRPLKRKCKFRIHVEYQDREHGFENLSQKQIRTRLAQGSHSYEIRTRDFEKGPRACFLEIGAFSRREFEIWSSSTQRQWVSFEENVA